ncbi:phage tail-collar fiber domain-containing protein [Janthinobacterium lividum]|uniref:phage tail-collar fiber domain-containing protein n=1 Tax=Janthinobacterium lividum TaxID=29581 RepID=UPI003531BBAC
MVKRQGKGARPGPPCIRRASCRHVGGGWIREIGIFDEAGDLCAVANCQRPHVCLHHRHVLPAVGTQHRYPHAERITDRRWVDQDQAKQDTKTSGKAVDIMAAFAQSRRRTTCIGYSYAA